MSIVGGVFTGDLTIDKDDPTLILDKNASGQSSKITGRMAGKDRWIIRLGNDEAESTANAGSNFDILRYADDGTYLGQPLLFNRATGLGTVAGDPTAGLGIVTKQYADAADALKVAKAGDTMSIPRSRCRRRFHPARCCCSIRPRPRPDGPSSPRRTTRPCASSRARAASPGAPMRSRP